VKSGQINADQQVDYEFYGTQGQDLALAIDNPKLLITVLGGNGLAVDGRAIRVPNWQGKIISTGKHVVQIKPIPGAKGEPFDYRLSARLTFPITSPTSSSDLITPSITPQESTVDHPVQDLPLTTPTGTTPLPVPITIPSSRSVPRSSTSTSTPQQTFEQPAPSPSNNQPFIEPSAENPDFPTAPSSEPPLSQPPNSTGNDQNTSTPAPLAPQQ
jgi:hypothetical protein